MTEHFTDAELSCRHCGRQEMDPEFMERLEAIRREYGKPMVVTSGYRCPEYNLRVSRTGASGPHTRGRAADIAVRGGNALELIAIAMKHGCTGIGVLQHGTHRMVHLDDLPDESPRSPRPWIWSYP